MKNITTIHNMLSIWGHRAHEVPSHNEKLKSEALAHFVNVSPVASAIRTRRRTPSSFPWASLAFASLALFAVLIMPTRIDQHLSSPESGMLYREPTGNKTNVLIAEKQSKKIQPANPAQYNTMKSMEYAPSSAPSFEGSFDASDVSSRARQEIPITDAREYLKTDYHAVIRTRRVQELAQRIQTTVRGFGGRVDELSSSPKYGSIRFIVPASQFNAFHDEITNLAGKRFLIEDIYTQNMLSQKQSIEQHQENAKKTLAELNVDRGELIANHRRVLTAIQSDLAAYVYELDKLRLEVTNDAVRKAQIAARIQVLLTEEKIVNARFQNENANYGKNLQSMDLQIRYAKDNLTSLGTQDQELLDTVATVRGTISLNWISLWHVANLYIPFPWIPILLMGAAIVTYIIDRGRNRLVIS